MSKSKSPRRINKRSLTADMKSLNRHGKTYYLPEIIRKETGLYWSRLKTLAGETIRVIYDGKYSDSSDRKYYCMEDAKDYIQRQALPEGKGRLQDIQKICPNLTLAMMPYYRERRHLALPDNKPKLDHERIKYKLGELGVWDIGQCKTISAWEERYGRSTIDADGNTYVHVGGGLYLDDSGTEWFDLERIMRECGPRIRLPKVRRRLERALGRAICTRKVRRRTKARGHKTKWSMQRLQLASDVQVIAQHQTCRRAGVFRCASGDLRMTTRGAERFLKLKRYRLNKPRRRGTLKAAEKMFVGYSDIWTYRLPAGVALPEGLDIPTLSAIPDKPLPLPGEEPAEIGEVDHDNGQMSATPATADASYETLDMYFTWKHWHEIESLGYAAVRDRWNLLNPERPIRPGKGGRTRVYTGIRRAREEKRPVLR